MYVAYIFVHSTLKRIKWHTLGAHLDNNTAYVESNYNEKQNMPPQSEQFKNTIEKL